MKKAMSHTRVSVKLRKNEFAEEWYLYLEAYPVFTADKPTAQRNREYLNRSIKTPLWEKSTAIRRQPKRDRNGIIQCRATVDQEACIYADAVRQIRQHEYDNAALYTDADAAQATKKKILESNFYTYFDEVVNKHRLTTSQSNAKIWRRSRELFQEFYGGDYLAFSDISLKLIDDFRIFLLTTKTKKLKSTLSQNAAHSYFSRFKVTLHQAYLDGFLPTDLAGQIHSIAVAETRREHLTLEELNRLANTPCRSDMLKRAALFSALTGLRHCDIIKMTWSEIQLDGERIVLNFTQKKTKGVEYMPISKQAYQLCGTPGNPGDFIFPGIVRNSGLHDWIAAAGITRKITFHCFRHTFATLQLANGTDIYTVSKMLGHKDVKTTQIYAKVVNSLKDKAANSINLDIK